MDELPRHAQDFLTDARSVHDAPSDPRVKERLRESLLARVALASASTPKSSSGKAWALSHGKLWIGVGLLVGAAALGLVALRSEPMPSRTPEQATLITSPDPVEPVAESGESVPSETARVAEPAPVPAHREAVTERVRRPTTDRSAGSLVAETELLSQASAALARKDVPGALAALRQHRQRYQRPVLREERDGLWALAQCMSDPARAAATARTFMTRFPGSLLTVRIKHACWPVSQTVETGAAK